jgi:DNA-binding GntR family transcriptional regulator
MQIIRSHPSLVDQVYEAILGWIEDGRYGADARLIQEEIAETLGVSRQPVQQALLLLRNMGVLINAPGRGLMVAPLDSDKVRDMYEIRSSLDALASGMAAERGAERARSEGKAFIERGLKAVESKVISELVSADMAFHHFIYELSGNRMVAETVEPHWAYLRRVMGEVLMMGASAKEIWDQHAAIMQAIADGDSERAQRLAKEHIDHAGEMVLDSLNGASGEDNKTAKAM